MNLLLEIIGWSAMCLILLAYFLISTNKVNSRNTAYQMLNLVGSVLFIIYLSIKQAWASVGLNAAWALIALYSLRSTFSKRSKK